MDLLIARDIFISIQTSTVTYSKVLRAIQAILLRSFNDWEPGRLLFLYQFLHETRELQQVRGENKSYQLREGCLVLILYELFYTDGWEKEIMENCRCFDSRLE
jgi:hypothetical protein